MSPSPLASIEEMVARLERALASSPADDTEIVWIEARRGQESNSKRRRDNFEVQERTLLVRVRESGRIGIHCTDVADLANVEGATRQALAQARLSSPAPPLLVPEGAAGEPPRPAAADLCDPELARMSPARARELIQGLTDRDETALLGWAEGRVAVLNSRGLRRAAEATSAWVSVSCGQTPGAGRAAAVARTLDRLNAAEVRDRARRRHAAAGDTAELPSGPAPLVLSPEGAAALVDLLNRQALTSSSFHEGTSFFQGRRGEAVFHPSVSLRDDATDPDGLPFPFDFLGSAKRPLHLIDRGVFLGPVVDERLARAMDCLPTPHLVAPDEAVAAHLFLAPGEQPDEELLRQADGGIWVGALDAVEGFDFRTLRFRAVARGVRRVEGGTLGAALPDLVWEGSLPDLLSRVLGVGRSAAPVAAGDPLFGATSAPMLAFDGVHGLRPAPVE
ncbi:MAG TPA: metallopeptidase TldD-related protein [Thermoanaerobaculia bacterium]